MDQIYQTIEKLCESKGCSITTMCRELDIPRSTLSDYKAGRLKRLPLDKLRKMADYFAVPLDRLLGTRPNRTATDDPTNRYPYLLGKLLDGTLTPDEAWELEALQLLNRLAGYLEQLNKAGWTEVEKRVRELTYVPEYQVGHEADPAADAEAAAEAAARG